MATVLSNSARTGISSVVGLLACQRNSYLRSLDTKVVGCHKIEGKAGVHYEVELEDTVLFPEGGGQPHDTGSLALDGRKVPVSNVQRDGLTAVHFTEEPFTVGATVTVEVDWARRWDHMQQHTGQHLLSAVLDRRNLDTLSWNLGAKFNYIELPRKLTKEEVAEVQEEVNDKIREAIAIRVEKDNSIEHKAPEDYDTDKGVIRVIHIGELDSNPCCGTHLSNTAEISAIALLHSAPVRGTNSRLFFMAGDRVTKFAAEANEMLRAAGALLSCQMEEIETKINRLNQSMRELNTREKNLTAQLARYEARDLKEQLEKNKFAALHKPDGSPDSLRAIEKELGKLTPGMGTIVLVSGQGKQGGAIIASGDEVEKYAEIIKTAVPNVKGGGKGKWQGKVVSWEKGTLESLLRGLSLD
ncbi:putative alanyl-tRNA editing protein alaX [Trichomonascus vanleenenianus]|uniref:putative alanine--tRNA ligase n=1 Tax=Trichomonascus vanleenenianus TaxID=2268995 RepID=UPI003ECA31A4